MTATRIERRFAEAAKAGRKLFVAYIMGGDPSLEVSQAVLNGMPEAGVDIIELGIPFTDPMADGPTIQLAGQRALSAGQTLARTLDMVAQFRQKDQDTPIVLMGYYNPIYAMGVDAFLSRAAEVGVDGLIVVDLPPEEDSELCLPAQAAGLNFIRLATPTTDEERLKTVGLNTSGFVYFVSITGITGAGSAQTTHVAPYVERLRAQTGLPVAVGFGVKTPDMAAEMAKVADAVVVGSAIVDRVGRGEPAEDVLAFVRELAKAVHG